MADDQYPRENADVDLLGSTCDDLSITTVQSVGRADMARRMLELMQAAPDHTQLSDQRGFGLKYGSVQDREGGTFLTLGGQVAYFEDDDGDPHVGIHIEVEALAEKPSPPPDEFSPFDDLLEVSGLLGDVQSTCTARFINELDESLESRILLPAPLLSSVGQSPHDFTHMESVVLSHRTADGLSHTVEVLRDDSFLFHIVGLSFKGRLTLESLQGIRVIAEQLSKTLLKSGDGTNEQNN